MTGHCPLCHGGEHRVRDEIRVDDLRRLYRLALGLDIGPELSGLETVCLQECARCGLSYFTPQRPGSGHFYEQLQRFDFYYMADKPEYRLAAEEVPTEARVLDVGCGVGAFADHLAHAHFFGLELNPQAIRAATDRGRTVWGETVEVHARHHASEYDVVSAFQVLEHVADVHGFLQACVACLRPGGRLILSVPNSESFVGAVSNNALNFPPHHMTWWRADTFRHVAGRFGLTLAAVHTEPLAPVHRRMYAEGLISNGIGQLLHRPPRPVDFSWQHRLSVRLARPLAGVVAAALRDPRLAPVGHSLTAILSKP